MPSHHPLLLLDFDGTLVETTPRPAQARLTPRRRALLSRLVLGPWRLAFLSGRSLDDLKARVGIPGAVYGGNFGLELAGPGLRFVHPRARACRSRLGALALRLSSLLAGIPGAQVEGKGLGLAVHERRVPLPRIPELRRLLAALIEEGPRTGLRWRQGDRAWEVLPDLDWGKREAAQLLWRRLGRPPLLAIGNDESDEGMFAAALAAGSAFRVGREGRSQAPRRLKDVRAVYRLLGGLLSSGRLP